MSSFPKVLYAANPIGSVSRGKYTMINILNLSSVEAWQSWGGGSGG